MNTLLPRFPLLIYLFIHHELPHFGHTNSYNVHIDLFDQTPISDSPNTNAEKNRMVVVVVNAAPALDAVANFS